LVQSLLKKIQFTALKSAANNISIGTIDNIIELNEAIFEDEIFLKAVHHLLFEIHVIEGFLICPASGRRFPIVDGIPNMLLHEDEV
jgi:multifunctional methyltransferase subunit TRM112